MKTLRIFVFFLVLIISGLSLFGQYQPINIDSFQIGADLSLVKAITDKGGIYYIDNKQVDAIAAFKSKNIDYARLRLFHTPDGSSSNGTVNSLPYTIALAKLIKASGMKLLLDFHYSDTWADPSRQTKPAAWTALNFNTLNDSIYAYTKKILNTFAENGVYPDMVQTGNEISHGMLWPDGGNWKGNIPNYRNFSTLLKSAIRGVRESTNGTAIPVVLHAATGGSLSDSRIFIDSLLKYDVQFDVIGLSYYVVWHGVISQLDDNLAYLNSHYNQNIIIAETNYPSGGTLPSWSVVTQNQLPFPFTEQGQYDYLQAIFNLAKKYPKVKGLYYWGGEVIWAGDIGGAYYSLFNWDGKARKALDAFNDLTTSILPSPFASRNYSIHNDSYNRIEIRSNLNVSTGTVLIIYDLQGKIIYEKILTGNATPLDFKPPVSGIYVVSISCNGNILHRENMMIHAH
ncbi:MAG: glycosyl hydrolase 53 family protein [Bacteroidia bacterium]|nr:glycosyl hydrolase 53 family protein [Bacteroidia bacterium]